MPHKYRAKPVEIVAAIVKSDNSERVQEWIREYGGRTTPCNTLWLFGIDTLEGNMAVSEGDYIIRGTHGEFYPCKPDIFEGKYERID